MHERFRKYLRPEALPTTYCPGCGHGIVLSSVVRAIDELGLDMDRMLFVSGIGCAGWIPNPHFAADALHVTHGRALPFATGAKLYNPDLKVMVISGDGDLASIGGNHLIHAARRNVAMTVVCANNAIYGMTGGQVAATTPHGAVTVTTPKGNPEESFDLSRLVACAGASYVARYSVYHARQLVKAIRNGLNAPGFAFIEAVSPCPTHYGKMNMPGTSAKGMVLALKDRCVADPKFPFGEMAGAIGMGEYVRSGRPD